MKTRVIPCLLLKEGGLVKSVRFQDYKYVGDPINAVKIFNEKEVDELIFLNIDASKHKKEPDYEQIQQLATECFMPFSYGGGVRTVEHIKKILRLGVEKVITNTKALEDLNFVERAAKHFGSSTIIGAVDVKKDFWGSYKVYDHTTKRTTQLRPIEYVMSLESAGVGEIFLNNVDRDGTYKGLDMELVNSINSLLKIPMIACGGISSTNEIENIISTTEISAIAAGSLFVFQGPHRAVLISYPSAQIHP